MVARGSRPALLMRQRVFSSILAVTVVGFASAPLILKALQDSRGVNLTRQEAPLTGSQVMRGAFLNTGSKDIGPDPQWQNGKYVSSREAAATFAPSPEDIAAARQRLEAKKAAAGLR